MRHYLDHASTSPLRPEARRAMRAALDEPGADPGRLHADALRVRAAIEEHRDEIAGFVGTRNRSVIFTSGATESITAAVWGASQRCERVAYAMVEHSAVRAASDRWFPPDRVTVLPVDRQGRIDPDAAAAAAGAGPALVHVQWVNHEVGTVQPVAEIVAAARTSGALVHVDAAQAVGKIPVDFDALGADLLSASAHKLGGPPGLGVLLVRRGLRLPPLLQGGAQERSRRAGLENAPAIAGLGAVAAALEPSLQREHDRVAGLSHRLRAGLVALDGVTLHGDADAAVPHIVSAGIDGVEPQAVLLGLDRAGVAAHSGSACAGEELEPSPVLRAMGVEADRSLRLSLGWSSTEADVDAVLAVLPDVLDRLRRLR